MLPKTDPALFTEAFWKRPQTSPKGNPNADGICQAVGRALSEWEHAEGALADLFCVVTRVTDAVSYRAVYRAYGTIDTSAGRREAITAAAEIHFSPYWDKARKSLDQLLEAVARASRRRDDIAHGIVASFTSHIGMHVRISGLFSYPLSTTKVGHMPRCRGASHWISLERAIGTRVQTLWASLPSSRNCIWR
jgi:hypothetical protein